ncbi:MBL fold metallo-hydrolase [Paenibacillus filicis]|uniref:MBL fold metallo-hydrolase n=1 Tax=Paenibacillus filicis TaxID=669464 RepID=A0ABU9DK61_9BACL
MHIQLIRHATLQFHYAGLRLLVDPMFSEAGSLPPVPNTDNAVNNPLVPLPVSVGELLHPDAILLTHNHPDHWDAAATQRLPRSIPVFCQPADLKMLQELGFKEVTAVESSLRWQGISLTRTSGQHGTGEIGIAMGPVSGFVLQADNEPSLYLAGDTIWCSDVQDALNVHQPDVIVLFGGGAEFREGGPITMTGEDVLQVASYGPKAELVVAHLDTWNHCFVTRADMRRIAGQADPGTARRIHIPADGDTLEFKLS